MAGYDQVPWHGRPRLSNGELWIERGVSDSGRVHAPYPVAGFGQIMLATGTLMERESSYHLAVELARGKVNHLRNQLADWEAVGLVVPTDVQAGLKRSLALLAKAATTQTDPATAATYAEQALDVAVGTGDKLVSSFVEQALAVRHRQTPNLPTWLGADMGGQVLESSSATRFLQAFNSATVPVVWRDVEGTEGKYRWDLTDRQVEWCLTHRLKICGGPLLKLDSGWLPDWLFLWENDFENLLSFVSDFVETTVNRYRGKVNLWHCAARFSEQGALSLDEEQRLRMVLRAVEVARRADPATPVVVRFDQPWAEFMGGLAQDLSPLHFADALVRSGVHLAGLALELNVGYKPGSWPRDRLDISRLIDHWSWLGLPLHIILCCPGDTGLDPTAAKRFSIEEERWSQAAQRELVESWVPLMLAKPAVHSVTWNQLDDSQPHELPHGGLFNTSRAPRPALRVLSQLRQEHLD